MKNMATGFCIRRKFVKIVHSVRSEPGIPALVVVSSCFFVLCVWASARVKWDVFIGPGAMSPVFADLRVITSNADCVSQTEWAVGSTDCDPWGRAYNYPSQLPRLLNFFGLGYAESGLLGIFQIFALACCWGLLVYVTRGGRLNLRHVALNALALFSPPVLLLVERGNSDILVFCLLVLIGVALSGNRKTLGGFLIVVATSLKLYPLGALLALLLTKGSRHFWWTGLTLAAAVGFVLLNYREWLTIAKLTPQPGFEGGFSSSIIFGQMIALLGFDSEFSRILGPALFLSSVIVGFVLVTGFERNWMVRSVRGVSSDLLRLPSNRIFFAVGLGSLLTTYILAASFDYRLVLLLMPIAALSGATSRPKCASLGSAWVLLAILYLTYPLPLGFQLIGDGLGIVAFGYFSLVLMRMIHQSFWRRGPSQGRAKAGGSQTNRRII